MKFNIFIILSTLFLLLSCDQTVINQSKKLDITFDKKYKNSGFSLIYNDNLKIKKIDQRSLTIFHKNLKRKSNVKITNPLNGKSLIAEVKSNRVKFSPFYNSIITQRIAEELELDLNEPYIDIVLISKNSTYIAKKTKTFEEEKNVANKAPVDTISINDLNSSKKEKVKDTKVSKFSYVIKVAEFYFFENAKDLKKRIITETDIQIVNILSISKNTHRIILGPYNNINSLQKAFYSIRTLGFENIEIIKNG